MYHRLKQLAPTMVPVPAGPFLMGSTPEQVARAEEFGFQPYAFHDESPQHAVNLEAFTISRGPITCAEYRAFLVATDYAPPLYWGGDDPPPELLEHPVVGVSLNDARAYCRWLSTATSRTFNLPTEAQWEKAARGVDGRVFPWGDQWEPGYCNIAAHGPGSTSAIGSFPVDTSPYGCVDMAGNVAEWTISRYRPYPGSSLDLPAQSSVAVRGGCWNGSGDLARCARRQHADGGPDLARGFRVVSFDEQG